MRRSLLIAAALAFGAQSLFVAGASAASDRALPMRFELRVQTSADLCAERCQRLIAATGAITADTPTEFIAFARTHDLAGALVVLDSDGGSVHGAMALGREIRRRALDTAVGRVVVLPGKEEGSKRIAMLPRADCESMCAFVLLAGINRIVPDDARVMVHQIWLGDRRDDPTAANYSAEDLVLVQRDIGRLAIYTAEMGASNDLLDLSLRIPPWEPMHALSRVELTRLKVATDLPEGSGEAPAPKMARAVPPAMAGATPVLLTSGTRPLEISDRRWDVVDRAGASALARRHPLTVEGDTIGTFDLVVSCAATGDSYDVSYVERRYAVDQRPLPSEVAGVSLRSGGREAALQVVSSERRAEQNELITFASATVPAALVDSFALTGNRSLTVDTLTAQSVTSIRLGNTGVRQNLPRLSSTCKKPVGDRADAAPVMKTGGMASAQ